MQFKLSQLMIAVALLGAAFWLSIPRVVIVSDGHFQLNLDFSGDRKPDSKFLFAYCWNETDADHASEYGASTNEIIFRPIESDPDGKAHVTLPCAGKSRRSGREISYHEPQFIVIQFNDDETILRKQFAIPIGRGDRSLSIDID